MNNNHVSFNGGPGGINHQAHRRRAERDERAAPGPTSFQPQHMKARDRQEFYAKPMAGIRRRGCERPMGYSNHGAQSNVRPQQANSFNNNHGNVNGGGQSRPEPEPPSTAPSRQPQYQRNSRTGNQRPQNESRPAPQHPQSRPQPQHEWRRHQRRTAKPVSTMLELQEGPRDSAGLVALWLTSGAAGSMPAISISIPPKSG